jgi:hypothetical protein
MPTQKAHFAVLLALLGTSANARAEDLRSAVFVSKTQSSEWSVLTFGGPVAERLYGFMEMQGEMSCYPMNGGAVTCNSWINGRGDLRSAAPEGADQVDMSSSLPGMISFLGIDAEDSSLALLQIQSSALVNLLTRPIGHDLYCSGQTCQFTIDTHGVIDPRPFTE